jgi:hypothetical protein
MFCIHTTQRLIAKVVAGSLLAAAVPAAVHAQGGSVEISAPAGKQLPGSYASPEELARAKMREKLATIVIPRVEFRSTSLSNAIEFLRQESVRLDPDPNPQARGVNLVLRLPPAAPAPVAATGSGTAPAANPPPSGNTRITMTLTGVPLREVLQYVATQADLKVRIDPYAVTFVPITENDETMITKVFRVPPSMIGNTSSDVGHGTDLDLPATAAH